ncbi:hypothetical protein ON010_g10041 [Phytophthora cinnamomi]|nr:hypothetical protein ON010_g10041 [Phytophthora cinnamomi]
MDVCKERLRSLHSFISAKRRARFDAVNHDFSTGNHDSGGYHCWCHLPVAIAETPDGISGGSGRTKANAAVKDAPIFEFGSDACRVYLIYTDTHCPPNWLSVYLNQLTVIQFEITAPFVETQALQKLLESQGRLRELTEIRTLQQDMVICDEQIFELEEELLEFFSTEQAEQVYAVNSKAIRIVANRSAVHTLENTKTEANTKINAHWRSLAGYIAVSKRCLDAVWAWREFDVVRNDGNDETIFSLSWIWELLIRAGGVSNKSNNNLEEVMACFTSYLQQCIVMNLRNEDRLLFRFLLAIRIWQRRMEEMTVPPPVEGGENIGSKFELRLCNRRSTDTEMLGHLLALINAKMERNSHDTCRPTLKSLLALRPKGMKTTAWSAVCYLAEASGDLRQFISRMEGLEDGQAAWKALIELGTGSSNDWKVPAPLDDFTRLCIVTAVHPHRFMCEIEEFSGRELQRLHTASVSSTHSVSLIPAVTTPSLPTLVAAAAHTATAQAPDRHRDLFFMWKSFSSSKTPLLVFCSPNIDFVDAVTSVASRAGATMDTTDTIQLLLADDVAFKTILLQAMERGQWVVLPNLESCHDRFAHLSSVYDSLEDGRVHSDFRLWISITNKHHAMRLASFDTVRLSRIASKRIWGTGSLSLKRSLHHSFAILKRELEPFEFASTISAANAADSSIISEYEEQCMKQLGVFHALVTTRDHFPFAEWKAEGEFGDPELCAVIRSLMTLRTEERTLVKELPNPLNQPGIGMWSIMTIRGVISSVYASTLKAPQDQLLIQSCIDLVLNAWPTSQGVDQLHTTTVVAQMTIPEVVFAIEKLAVIPWVSVVGAIPHLWISESCGPSLSRDLMTAGHQNSESASLWDPSVPASRSTKTNSNTTSGGGCKSRIPATNTIYDFSSITEPGGDTSP